MKSRCQIRTSAKKGRFFRRRPSLSALRFPTDSKTLSSFRSSPNSASVGIGLERAFTEAPPDKRRFHPEAA